jgi:predicted MFS family arabinose efflux permease
MMNRRSATRRLIAFSILNHSAFAGSRVVVSLSGLQLHASPFAIGLMLSFYALLPAFLSVSGGRWIDRVGLRRPMLLGTTGLVLGVAVPCVLWDVGALYLASVSIGLSFMAYHLASQKAMGEASDDQERRMNFSQFALGFSISGFVGPTSAGFLIDWVGHRATFGVLALMPLAALLMLGRHGFAHAHRTLPREPAQPAQNAQDVESVLDLVRSAELKRLFVAVVLISSCWDVHQFLVPLYGAQLGFSASSIGLVLGAFSAATFVIRALLPVLSRALGEWPLILTAMASACAVYAVYPFFPVLPAMLGMSFVLGLGLGISQPMVLSVLHRASPPHRIGEASGLRLMLVNITQTVLPTGFGAVSAALGLAPLFWGMAALVGAGAVYAARGYRAAARAAHRQAMAGDAVAHTATRVPEHGDRS